MDDPEIDQFRLVSEDPAATIEKEVQETGFIQLRSRAHDISFIESHISGIKKLGADLNAAVQAILPARNRPRYSNVNTLMVSWQDDDLGVQREIVQLRNVLRNKYNFDVEEYRIPPRGHPDRTLKREVINFLDSADGEDTLLIFYYAGHARRAPGANTAPLWCANRRNPEPAIASGGIQSMFEEARADVLLLYDCCHSAASDVMGSIKKRHVMEVIAACGYETVAPEADKHSFTKALTEMLALKATTGPFSVGDLHARVLSKLKFWVPGLLTDESGNFIEDDEGMLVYERQPRRTPIYSILCETEPRRSILLAPLPERDSSSTTSAESDLPDTPSSSSPDPVPWHIPATEMTTRKRKRIAEDEGPCAQILLAVRLEGDNPQKMQLDIPRWTEWIRNLPFEGTDIRIEGAWQSFSTLLLLRMPVAVWNLLPQNPAYSFVGFVTSDDLSHRVKHTSAISVPPEECPSVQSTMDSESVASHMSVDQIGDDGVQSGQRSATRRKRSDAESIFNVGDDLHTNLSSCVPDFEASLSSLTSAGSRQSHMQGVKQNEENTVPGGREEAL